MSIPNLLNFHIIDYLLNTRGVMHMCRRCNRGVGGLSNNVNGSRNSVRSNRFNRCGGVSPFNRCGGVSPYNRFGRCGGVSPFNRCGGVSPYNRCGGVSPFNRLGRCGCFNRRLF